MNNKYFKILLLGALMLLFATVSFAQKTKPKPRPKMIMSEDFKSSASSNTVRNNNAKKGKKWRKRCRYEYFRRKGRTTRVYRCRSVKY